MNVLARLPQRWRKGLLIAAGLFLAYTAFGFLLLPRLLHDTLTETLANVTHRPVKLAELKINPLALSATLHGLEIGTVAQPLASCAEIYINFSLSSLWQRAYLFETVRLQSPRVVIAIDREGRFNFQQMLAPGAEKSSGPPPVLLVHSFEVMRGAVDFDDRSRPEPFHTNISTLDFSLRDFTTRRDRAGNYRLHAATDLGETLDWQGTLQAAPFRSAGTLQLAGIHSETIWKLAGAGFKFNLEHGLLDLKARYLVDLTGAAPQFRLDGVNLALRDLQLLPHGASEPVLLLPHLDVSGLGLDWSQRTVSIGESTFKDAQLHAVRQTNGQLDLQTLFAPAPQTEAQPQKSARAPSKPTPPWQIKLKSVQLQGADIELEDRTTQPPVRWQLKPLNLALQNIALGTNNPIDLQLDSGINVTGSASLHGTVTLAPLSANLDLHLATFDLTAVQPYLQRSAQLQLRQGVLNVDGHLSAVMGEGDAAVNFSGAASVDKLQTVDTLRSEDFVRWQRLAVNDLKYDSRAARLSIAELVLSQPYLRFTIAPDSSTNLSHILAVRESATPAAVKAPAVQARAAPLITIDRVRVVNGDLNFTDQSIKPSFNTGIEQLNGTIRGLSSKELARADVDLKGKVDRHAPATISGKINPLSEDAFTDLTLDFRGIEMSAFSPYSGKFAGYRIDKGKLNVELHYLLSKKELHGDNRIVIDQLQLGEAVESPDATGLPVRLAIAILKDANGVIDLDLPVSGRIDDPDFHYGRIVWLALKNVIIKVATAPFRALAALMGGREEGANQVSFAPGTATLGAAEQEKLGKLAQALSQRPALMLEVRGTAGAADAAAIAATALQQRLLAQPGASRQQKISALYLKVYGAAATTLLPPLAKDEKRAPEELQMQAAATAEKRLLAAMVVSEEELRLLAQDRAEAIIDALADGKERIDPARIFLLDVDTRAEPAAAVVVPLSLRVR